MMRMMLAQMIVETGGRYRGDSFDMSLNVNDPERNLRTQHIFSPSNNKIMSLCRMYVKQINKYKKNLNDIEIKIKTI